MNIERHAVNFKHLWRVVWLKFVISYYLFEIITYVFYEVKNLLLGEINIFDHI